MKNLKSEILDITDNIIMTALKEEYPFYDISKDMLYKSLSENKEEQIEEHSHFGGDESIISMYVLAVIAFIASELGDAGVKIAKISLYEYLKDNRKKLEEKYTSNKYKKALDIIEKYLKKEIE